MRTIHRILLIACLGLTAERTHARTDHFFFNDTSSTLQWTGQGVRSVTPKPDVYRGNPGLTLHLPMKNIQDRAYWDTKLDLDLLSWRAISFDLQIDDPAAVKRASLYFRSGDGWLGGWFEPQGSGWQTITLARADFHPEGTPVGWNKINGVRIAFWKQDDINTTARIANLRATNVPILILRNTDARATKPEDADFADRLVDRLKMWFQQYAIPVAVITDNDLREGPPPAQTRLIILPFNPVLTNQIPQRIEAFVQQGGKIMNAYALDAGMASLLGLQSWQWMKADPKDRFAMMHFEDAQSYALPERVPQDSWNINRPIPSSATVLAYWMNGQKGMSDIPAVTINENGAFFSHVLTNTGREEKMRMLMALIAKLAPDLAPELSSAMLRQSTQLLDQSDWQHTRRFIAQTALEHNRNKDTERELKKIEKDLDKLKSRISSLSFQQAATHAQHVGDRIQNSYYQSLSPKYARPNEFRGLWAHDAAGIRGLPWKESMAKLKKSGMNNLFANVLWGGAAFYPSEVLPQVPGSRDYAQAVVTAAKAAGIQVHAWMVLWNLQYAPDAFIENMRQAKRLQADIDGKELPWLCPSHPDNQTLTRDVAREVVTKYPFDGFHFDYIRYPHENACYCQGCRQRFQKATGITIGRWPAEVATGKHKEDWLQWRRNIINTVVQTTSRTLRIARPDIKISAAVWSGWPSIRDSIAQDWPVWAKEGWIDFFTPMNYVTTAEEAVRIYQTQRNAVVHSVPIYPGIAPSTLNLSPATTLWHIEQLRKAGVPGFTLFDFDRDLLEKHLPAMGAGATKP